jgi:hypothetical protein
VSQYISKTSKPNFLQWKSISLQKQIIVHFDIFGAIIQNLTNEFNTVLELRDNKKFGVAVYDEM